MPFKLPYHENHVPTFKHFSHNHLLSFYNDMDFGELSDIVNATRCAICCRLFIGKHSLYSCSSENNDGYTIHKTCADLPQHLNHPLHSHLHNLTLIIRNISPDCPTFDSSTTCYYCDLPFQKYEPSYYKCDRCLGFYMHPTCSTLPLLAISNDDREDRFSCHDKPLSLAEKNHDDEEGEKCFACGSTWSGLQGYRCVESACKNFLHKSCVEKLARTVQHPFHPQHPLTLRLSKPRTCVSCFRKDCRLVFSCVKGSKCNSNIHLCTKCVFLEKKINCQSHDHSLSLVENFSLANARDIGIRCEACRKDQKLCDEVDATQTYLFRCMECDFNLHFLCGPLPITLKFEFHIHPLTLVDHLVTKDDSDEYYCDVCEEKRDVQYRLYYCKSCKFNAHIHCLLHEIIKVIKGDNRNVEFCALGENRWITYKLGNLEQQENDITLNDLMNSLTQQEKKLLVDPSGLRDEPNSYLLQIYNSARRINSHFKLEVEGSVEDINWIQQLFQFGGNDFAGLYSEIFSTIIEGLKVDEKYKRQKLIDVNGYFVPKTLAPILNTLLVRHGIDAGGNSSALRREMKSVSATILCATIDDMCRANIEDITMENLARWYSNLFGGIVMTGFKKFIDEHLFRILVIAYPGLKAMKVTKDVSEELEAKLKLYEENRKKLAEYKGEASDFMKDSMFLAEKLKGKKVGDLWFPY